MLRRCFNMTMFDVSVRNPITRSFTTYEIAIETSDPAFTLKRSYARRRYSEFSWLRKRLQFHHPACEVPELPPKQIFGTTDINFIILRMKALESWIIELTKEPMFISDTTVHLFLQTELPCGQIEKYLKGEISEEYIQSFWKASSVAEDDCKTRENTEENKSSIINRENEHKEEHEAKDTVASNASGVDSDLSLSGSSTDDLVSVSDFSSHMNSGSSAENLKATEKTRSYPPLSEVDSDQSQSLGKSCFSEHSGKCIDVDRFKQEVDHIETKTSESNMTVSSANKCSTDDDMCSSDDNKGSFDAIEKGSETNLESGHMVLYSFV